MRQLGGSSTAAPVGPRRQALRAAAAACIACALPTRTAGAAEHDPWGASRQYPSGWGGGYSQDPAWRVGNYSGGFERMVRIRTIRAAATPSPLTATPLDEFRHRWNGASRSVDDYLASHPATGLLIARRGELLIERYRFDRKPDARFTSWSMAKSVTSLLLGIAIDRGLIGSLDDTAAKHVPNLADSLHGQVPLRHLVNMSSGSAVVHDRDNPRIYPRGLIDKDSDLEALVRGFNTRADDAGQRFNYNELCPLTIGMVLRAVTGSSLAEFAEQAIWQPMGAQGNATWQCDSRGKEFNCVGLAAQLRDWARLGQLVAQQGEINGMRIVSAAWIDECCRWRADEQQVTFGRARPGAGYKAFMWHAKADGTQPAFYGHHGQRVMIDMSSQTVLVHTAVDQSPSMMQELQAVFAAAVALRA